jgi:hypothetical protein
VNIVNNTTGVLIIPFPPRFQTENIGISEFESPTREIHDEARSSVANG